MGILDKLKPSSSSSSEKTATTPATSSTTKHGSSGTGATKAHVTESMIIDEAVPSAVNVPGPTTVEYDLEGRPRPEIASTNSPATAIPNQTNRGGVISPGQSLPNSGSAPVPVVEGDDLRVKQSNNSQTSGTGSKFDPRSDTSRNEYGSSERQHPDTYSSHQPTQGDERYNTSPSGTRGQATAAGVGAGVGAAGAGYGANKSHQQSSYTSQDPSLQSRTGQDAFPSGYSQDPHHTKSQYPSEDPSAFPSGYSQDPHAQKTHVGANDPSAFPSGYAQDPHHEKTKVGANDPSAFPSGYKSSPVGAGTTGSKTSSDPRGQSYPSGTKDHAYNGKEEDDGLIDKIKNKLNIGSDKEKTSDSSNYKTGAAGAAVGAGAGAAGAGYNSKHNNPTG